MSSYYYEYTRHSPYIRRSSSSDWIFPGTLSPARSLDLLVKRYLPRRRHIFPVNTDQQQERQEEGFIDDLGNVIVQKRVTRVVTTTRTIVGEDGEPQTETFQEVYRGDGSELERAKSPSEALAFELANDVLLSALAFTASEHEEGIPGFISLVSDPDLLQGLPSGHIPQTSDVLDITDLEHGEDITYSSGSTEREPQAADSELRQLTSIPVSDERSSGGGSVKPKKIKSKLPRPFERPKPEPTVPVPKASKIPMTKRISFSKKKSSSSSDNTQE